MFRYHPFLFLELVGVLLLLYLVQIVPIELLKLV